MKCLLLLRSVTTYVTFLSLVLCFNFLGCKKAKSAQEEKEEFFFENTSITLQDGVIVPTIAELDSLGYVEDLDTALIPTFKQVVKTINSRVTFEITGLPTPGNQGKANSCVGWAVGYGLMSQIYTRLKGNFTGSPNYVWNQVWSFSNGSINLAKALDLVKEDGCCNIVFMPPTENKSASPSIQAKENAKYQTIADFHPFKSIKIERVKYFLEKGYVLPVALEIDSRFENGSMDCYERTNAGFVYRKKSEGIPSFRHAMIVTGYDDALKAFKLMNSKGDKWANKGYVWIDYQVFVSMVVSSGLFQGDHPSLYWVLPQAVLTKLTSEIKATTAKAEGIVLSGGGWEIIERGICWSHTTNKPKVPYDSYKSNGKGVGNFNVQLQKLQPFTKYYYRTYGKKENGTYYYGEVDSFVTAEVAVLENGAFASSVIISSKGSTKTYTLGNMDLSVAPDLDYNPVNIKNNSNNAVTITTSKTNNYFSLTFNSSQPGDQNSTFDVFYNNNKLQTFSVDLREPDSTELYRASMVGNWKLEVHNNLGAAVDIHSTYYRSFDASGNVWHHRTEYYTNQPPDVFNPPLLSGTWTIVRLATGYHLKALNRTTLNPLRYPIGNFWEAGEPTLANGGTFYSR